MDDTFRLEVKDYDREYIQEVLGGFLEGAPRYGRKLVEIRMNKMMFDKLAIEEHAGGGSFRGVPIIIADTGFEETIEVILGPLH